MNEALCAGTSFHFWSQATATAFERLPTFYVYEPANAAMELLDGQLTLEPSANAAALASKQSAIWTSSSH